PFLEAMLADIVAGQVIGENISGVEAGDAYVAGTSAMLGQIAQGRGMTPMDVEGMKEYTAATAESKESMVAIERYEASKHPFDSSNQYSFIGSLTRSLYPSVNKAQQGAAGTISGVASIITQGFASLVKPASAAGEDFNEK